MSGIGEFVIGESAIGRALVAVDDYLRLITSEHNQQPDFIAMLTAYFQPLVDAQNQALDLPTMFDLDFALGEQLDFIGLWIGRTRFLKTPITGVYFTYDDGPGYDSGLYIGPFDPVTGLTRLPDEPYRTLLKATAAANQWDGTLPGAYAAYAIMLEGTGFAVLIYDYQDMSMAFALLGPGVPDAITRALFVGGYLNLKPAGVRVRDYIVSANPDAPVFAYDIETNPNIGGYDVGAYAEHIDPS